MAIMAKISENEIIGPWYNKSREKASALNNGESTQSISPMLQAHRSSNCKLSSYKGIVKCVRVGEM